MEMSNDGMGQMGEMKMPIPKNTLPMMTGEGPFGPIEMGGMFTVLKIRNRLKGNKDPGWYKYPKGTVASKVDV
jgi:manganese oxidase